MEISTKQLFENLTSNPFDTEHINKQNSLQDLCQLICKLKNSIFMKYISKYLIEQIEQVIK